MFDLKAQSINDRNKLVELMAEMDLCNQRIMQQDAEIRILRDKLRKMGIDDGYSKFQTGSQTHSLDPDDSNALMSSLPQDKFQAMKSGLQVRTTLMKMAQSDEIQSIPK